MAFDPITAGIDLVKTFSNKFFADKMSEEDKARLDHEAEAFVAIQAHKEDSSFRQFVVQYEGAAKDYANLPIVGPLILLMRGVIRPGFTILVAYLDWLYFTSPAVSFTDEQGALLKAVNLIILMFWFGERAITNTGIVDKLMAYRRKE